MRLISTAAEVSEWMTEEQIFGLIRNNVNFVDVTEQDKSLRQTKRVGAWTPWVVIAARRGALDGRLTQPLCFRLCASHPDSDPDRPGAPGPGQDAD